MTACRVVTLALVSGLLVVLLPWMSGTVAAASTDVTTPPSALDNLGGCIRERDSLDVLFLMDQSKSVRTTDQPGNRINAAQVAVDELRRLVDTDTSASGAVAVQVAVAGFAGDYTSGAWHPLHTNADASTIDHEIANVAGNLNGSSTDYLLALNRARETLAAHAGAAPAANGQPPCQAIVWFTDGRYDPDDTNVTPPPGDPRRHALCDSNGSVDQLNASGTTLMTVALTTDMRPADEQFLQSVVGIVPGCASPRNNGYYVAANRPADIVDAFARLVPGPPGVALCRQPANQCSFDLDRHLHSFYLLIHVPDGTRNVVLHPPTDQTVPLSRNGATTAKVAGTRLRWAWFDSRTDDVVAVTGVLPPDAVTKWSGTWQVTSREHSLNGHIYLYGDLQQAVVGSPQFVRGAPWRFKVDIQSDGAPATADDLRTIDPAFAVRIANGSGNAPSLPAAVTWDPRLPDTADVDFTAPLDWHDSVATVTVNLRIQTASGIDLSPTTLIVPVPVMTPMRISPAQLKLSPVYGRGQTSGTVTVAAGDTAGCAWVVPQAARFDAVPVPVDLAARGAGGSRSDCIHVGRNSSGSVHVTLTLPKSWGGTVNGIVPVMTRVDGSDDVEVDVPVRFVAVHEVVTRNLWLAIGLLALFTVAPLLVLLLVNRFIIARFLGLRTLGYVELTTHVTPGTGLQAVHVEGLENWPKATDVRQLNRSGRRRLTIGPIQVRARSSRWDPFRQPFSTIHVRRKGHELATHNRGPSPFVTLPTLALPGLVVVTAAEQRDPHDFTVTIIVVLGADPAVGESLRTIQRNVAAAAGHLRPKASFVSEPAESQGE